MFNHPGQKIKLWATAAFVLLAIAYVVIGIVMMVQYHFGIGIAVLIGGLFTSYLGPLLLFGFGQLIENTDSIRQALRKKTKGKEETNVRTDRAKPIHWAYVDAQTGACPLCGAKNVRISHVDADMPDYRICKNCYDKYYLDMQ